MMFLPDIFQPVLHCSSPSQHNHILPTASQHKRKTYTNYCIYRVVSPDGEQ